MENVELMVNDIIKFLKKKKLWDANTGIIYDGKHATNKGIASINQTTKGVARMWFEGQLNHALNHGINDPEYKVYKGLELIMNKHGFYPEFDTNCDFNIYQLERA